MPSAFRYLAAASAVLSVAALASAATRPRYGGKLRIEISASVSTLDPDAPYSGTAETVARARLDEMLFERLTALDANARPEPRLATSWSHDPENRKWQFSLRAGVKLSDGTLLSVQDAVLSLSEANREWHVTAAGNTLVIETNSPLPDLPAELARPRNSIFHRAEEGALLGSGPFRLSEWNASRRALLEANDTYWGGRPYLDEIEITMGKGQRDQLIDLELGRADVVELGIEDLRHAAQENLRTIASAPSELMAIVFVPGRPAGEDVRLRQALALSIDRATIRDVLLQKQGEPAGGLLPEWLTGYAFLFPAQQDVAEAKRLLAQVSSPPAFLTLGYDAASLPARAVAERISLNARDAGLKVRVAAVNSDSPGGADALLVRVPLVSADLRIALAAMAAWLHEPVAQLKAESAAPGECFQIEHSLLKDFRVIPLFHLPVLVGVGPHVREWSVSALGDWRPESVWLEAEKP
jgi:peptide/nickel transport system substrate-binding protein